MFVVFYRNKSNPRKDVFGGRSQTPEGAQTIADLLMSLEAVQTVRVIPVSGADMMPSMG